MRKLKFQTGEYYHVYNRGVDKRTIFLDKWDYERFLTSIKEFNLEPAGGIHAINHLDPEGLTLRPSGSKLTEIVSYNFLPNHFHFILKQNEENGVSNFIGRVQNGYTKYFNNKYNRTGSLLQGPFKAIHIQKDSYLLWLASYVNGNAEIHKVKEADKWPWSSYNEYINNVPGICNKKPILDQFQDINEFKNLTKGVIIESKQKKDDIARFVIE